MRQSIRNGRRNRKRQKRIKKKWKLKLIIKQLIKLIRVARITKRNKKRASNGVKRWICVGKVRNILQNAKSLS